MSPKVSTKQDTKFVLIETGIDVMLEKGYNATGINEVLTACNVPKGSFYHYFSSKEAFGLAVINTFDEHYVQQLDKALKDAKVAPLKRIKNYIDGAIEKAEKCQCSRGCLIANLSQEMADQNEVFRIRLKEIMQRRQATFAAVLNEAKAAGAIPKSVKTSDAAEFFLCAFEGSIMRSKVMRDTKPMKIFRQIFFSQVLRVGG
ncbi:MAG: TetR family transcriptional regulator C-terminal domain-containing protein [Candidatus Melainabacteria bacterium]|nr:TetR family transcriptional regulator C-terminal domain-containing protein [Candidatus Melainabacteria bacterium]